MKLIINQYLKQFLHRYDKDGVIPYLSHEDFPNLIFEEKTFVNSRGNEIHYYRYFYDNDDKDIVFFCPGIGPGHTAYLREIERLAKEGYVVYSIDYTGCDKSSGSSMISIYEPSRDVDELLNLLNFKKPFVLFGHSLGGFTVINIAKTRKDIYKTVCMSGFLSPCDLLKQFIKSNFIVKDILKYETKMNEKYSSNNLEYLKETNDKIMFIHSRDDQMVNFSNTIDKAQSLDNKNLSFCIVENKKHNPDYTYESHQYMNKVFGKYYELLRQKKNEDAKEYMKDKSAFEMTNLDEEVFKAILEFIK